MGSAKSRSAPSPVATPQESIELLQALFVRGRHMVVTAITAAELEAYKAALKGALVEAFGRDSHWTHDTMNAEGAGAIGFVLDEQGAIKVRREELRAKLLVLTECIEHLKRAATRQPVPAPQVEHSPLKTLENILRQFPQVVSQLRTRRAKRSPLKMDDEYDVQYLLHALLLVSFRDVRPEETGPSVAGARPRLDFLLKEEKIVIEVKKTRPTLADKELGDELLVDISRYKGHEDCKTLVCFVYDPGGHVRNAAGLIRDLEKTSSAELKVRVLIVPRH